MNSDRKVLAEERVGIRRGI